MAKYIFSTQVSFQAIHLADFIMYLCDFFPKLTRSISKKQVLL